jgi:NAD(P)-dependent dehydrogenase (short-subunit alcohol dehydrogenase family)
MPAEKVALITGAGRGIGRGIAEALAGYGWRMVLNYRADQAAAEAARARVDALGGEAACVQADVGRIEDHERLVRAAVERFGQIDLLVNNAGMAPRQRTDMLAVDQASYDEVMETNLKGPFFLTQRVAREMIAQTAARAAAAPRIVNIGSVSAVASSTRRAEYCISKAGLSMMSQLWAHRLADYGISVYEVRPGIIETDMTAGVKEKYDRLLLQEGVALLRRWGQPQDVGKAVAAIAEGMLPYSTGEVIYVDGGLHVRRL